MKKIACLLAMMASLAAWAGSAVVDGTDFVVTAEAGESFTNSTAVGNYARLLKEGDGEVVLTAATTAFTAAAVNGTPTLAFEGEPPSGVKWTLFKKGNGTYNFGAIIGTMILLK